MTLLDQLAVESNLQPLTEGELEELLRIAPPALRQAVARLAREVKVLRDAAGEREQVAAQEIAW
jgi:hypothetical protein